MRHHENEPRYSNKINQLFKRENLENLGRFAVRKLVPAMAVGYLILNQPGDHPVISAFQIPDAGQHLTLDTFYPPDQPFAAAAERGETIPPENITSAVLAGEVAVLPIFPDSNGNIDPQTMPDWTDEQIQTAVREITEGLNWWTQWDQTRTNLNFVFEPLVIAPTGYEPITHDGRTDEGGWIGSVMAALGYNDLNKTYFENARSAANDLRIRQSADWGILVFIVNDINDPDHMFPNFISGYAYFGGPFMVLTYNNNGYGPDEMDAVTAHELGHIVYMWDENPDWACTLTSLGYISGIPNRNSLQPPGCDVHVGSIMEGGDYPYTHNQLSKWAAMMGGLIDQNKDGILDPAGNYQNVFNVTLTEPNLSFTGTITNTAWPPSAGWPEMNINFISTVEASDPLSGQIFPVTATDGAFDEQIENYTLTTPSNSRMVKLCFTGYIGGTFCQLIWDTAKHQYLPVITK